MILIYIGTALCLLIPAILLIAGENSKNASPKNYQNLTELTDAVRDRVTESQNQNIYEMNLSKADRDKLIRQKTYLRNALRFCSMGDRGSREYVRDYIRGLLETEFGISPGNISVYFPLSGSGSSAYELFEYMYLAEEEKSGSSAFAAMYDACCMEKAQPFDGESIVSLFEAGRYDVRYEIWVRALAQRIYEILYGFGASDLLIFDRSIDGISGGVGGSTHTEYDFRSDFAGEEKKIPGSKDVICVMFRGRNMRLSFLSFQSEKNLERVVKNISRYDAGYALSRNRPVLVCSLMDNSRVVVARPPVSASWVFYVRRFTSSGHPEVEKLITDTGCEKVIELIKLLVGAEQNIMISGNQGGGKTTLLKSLICFIDPSYTLRVAETAFELNLNELYPERNVQALQERGGFTLFDALTTYKKTDTDIIILGEINEPKIAGALVQIVQNGGRMALSTLHHNSTEKMIDYLRNALVSEYGISDTRIAEEQAAGAVDFDIHMVRDLSGHHFIERITEIVHEPEGNHCYGVRNIVVYDRSSGAYRFCNQLSRGAVKRISDILGADRIDFVFREEPATG